MDSIEPLFFLSNKRELASSFYYKYLKLGTCRSLAFLNLFYCNFWSSLYLNNRCVLFLITPIEVLINTYYYLFKICSTNLGFLVSYFQQCQKGMLFSSLPNSHSHYKLSVTIQGLREYQKD